MAETDVAADWAWISKDPAEGIGYGVLATSAATVDFRPFIGRYVPGSPSSSTPPGAPDAPPWVTFGPVNTQQDGVLMSVSVRDPWQERDHAGRPVWPQRLLVMRFADLAAADASYQSMWAVAHDAPVPREDPAPLRLPVVGQPATALTATIKDHELQLMAVAAALLDGPVAISDAGDLRRDERLAVLDAIAALLPYGFRAELSASSVVDNTVEHGIRLSFADYPGPGQQLLSLRTPPPPAGSELSGNYLATLREKADTCKLPAVVEHLWAFKNPCSFDYPGDALTILSELDFFGGFSQALREGRASRAQILRFFAHPVQAQEQWVTFDPAMRENVISPYLADRDQDVTVAVLSCWEFTRHDVVKMINDHLDVRGPNFGVWCLQAATAVAANVPGTTPPGPVADQLLAKMLVPVGLNAKDRTRRIGILVQLLRQCAVPGPRQFPYTCDELRFGDLGGWQADLVRELLTQETTPTAPAERAGSWVKWLCASPLGASLTRPPWVTALDVALSPSPAAPGAANIVCSVIRHDVAWAVVLLRLAKRFRCFSQLLTAANRELIELAAELPAPAGPGNRGVQLLAELDHNLWEIGLPPATVAAIDVTRVLLGGPPRHLADRLAEAQLRDYIDALSPALALEIVTPRRTEVEQAFLGFAMSGRTTARLEGAGVWLLNAWAKDADRITGLCDYVAGLEPSARPYNENLSDAYWEALAKRPGLAGYAAGQRLMIVTNESATDQRTAFRRKVTDHGLTSTPLARACYTAWRAGLPPSGIVTALASGGADRIAPGQLDDVLREVQQLLLCSYPNRPRTATERSPQQTTEADLLACQALIAWGGLGDAYGEEFRQYLIDRWRGHSRTQRQLVRILRRAGRKRGRLDQSQWVASIAETGTGMARPPWYQRWLGIGRQQLDEGR